MPETRSTSPSPMSSPRASCAGRTIPTTGSGRASSG
jgi:hypothetical protein